MDEFGVIAQLERQLTEVQLEVDRRRDTIHADDFHAARAALRSAEGRMAILSAKIAQLRVSALLDSEPIDARNDAETVPHSLPHLRSITDGQDEHIAADLDGVQCAVREAEHWATRSPLVDDNAIDDADADTFLDKRAPGDPGVVPYTGFGDARARASTIILPASTQPTISVIIRLSRDIQSSIRCLQSIANVPPSAATEVIAVCDARNTPLMSILARVRGLRLLPWSGSTETIDSLNHAAAMAHGRYVMFLSERTEVAAGWLDELLTVFSLRGDALITGAKILRSDGSLHQAGAVMWRDGTAYQYGHMDDSRLPQYNYLRECDYVSAVAMLVDKEFFRAVGGFDATNFAEALYDADLAFKARAAGFKVYYQPASQVVLRDSVASTPNVSATKTFVDLWNDVLERDQFSAGTHIFAARERALRRPCMLVLDHRLIQPDKDAGSRTMFHMMRAFCEMGVDVKFWSHEIHGDSAYAAQLQQLGIETLYGIEHTGNFDAWIRQYGGYVDYVLVSRPEIAAEYLDAVRSSCTAKIIYYGHDIHHFRLRQQTQFEPQNETLRRQETQLSEIEHRIWEQVDTVYYPSVTETEYVQSWLKENGASAVARTIPVLGFDSFPPLQQEDLSRRQEVIFVAGFDHLPNRDAAQWFVHEVLPRIHVVKPDLHISFVGSNPPPEVLALAGEHVAVTGWVSEEDLERHYKSARVAIAPLRYGAGVKAKVIEAMRFGLPMVTTSVGAQGLEAASEALVVHDDPEAFAQAVCVLFDNDDAWRALSGIGQSIARRDFSVAALRSVLAQDVIAERGVGSQKFLSGTPKTRTSLHTALTPERGVLEEYLSDEYGVAVAKRVLNYFTIIDSLQREDVATKKRHESVASLIERIRRLSEANDDVREIEASIIIPVYGQIAFTAACVLSLLEHKCTTRYEIIIANDCSTDETRSMFEAVGGILRCVTHETNHGFLRNCNLAAAQARGKYIVLLNNDTLVLDHWLDHLLAPFGRFRNVGLTGSKLLMADGTLQEAGGIVWRDASAWNYGRNQDPRRHEYNYVRDVDYASAASVAVPRDLWNELGGFDERYAPAYCEDTDLAFRVRARNLRTLYSPRSQVIHHEGVSHGTDTSSGIKACQVVNQQKFFAEWKHVLESRHFANGEQVFFARDRSQTRKHVLVIDHYVPQFDRDGGSRMMYDYLRMFVDAGMQVTFWPDNLFYDREYARALQDYGIDVLYGVELVGRFAEWIKEHGAYFDYVFLSRAHICTKYVDDIAANSRAKLLYYGHDLTFPRLQKEYELTGRADVLEEIEHWRATETHMWRTSDVIYYPAPEEVAWVAERAPDKKVRPFRIQVYPNEGIDAARRRLHQPSAGRPVAVFVGGFAHRPNGDAAVWYVREILPLVRKRVPDVSTIIVGSYPTPEVLALASDDVVVTGYVSDPVLEWFYRTAAVVIAPLRYGGGMKGKVIEAARFGAPVVTTSCGSDGFIGAEAFLNIANDAEGFADGVVRVISDRDWACKRAAIGLDYVEREYGYRAVAAYMSTDIPELSGISENNGLLAR